MQLKFQQFLVHAAGEIDLRYPFKALSEAAGIFELDLSADKGVQQRPLGCAGPGDREFTFLLPATKRENGKTRWTPKRAISLAEDRRRIVLGPTGWRFIRDLFPDEEDSQES